MGKEIKTTIINGKSFEVPKGQIYCEKCGTTNFIYDDMNPPYKCDECGIVLDEAGMQEIDLDELQYEHEEGKYDAET